MERLVRIPANTLVIRADASIAIATGHVMRCLALAQAWQDTGGYVVFAMAESTPSIDARLQSEGMEFVRLQADPNSAKDATDTAALAHDRDAAWVVADGYRFDSEYQLNLKNSGLKLLFVDDMGQCTHYFADLVLNQNVHASERMYANRESSTRLLLGSGFAMLRRDFKSWSEWKREINPKGSKVLVMMGGSDPCNVTALVLEALGQVHANDLQVIAVVGGSNPNVDVLKRFASQSPATRFVRDAANMPELMAWADIAVSAAGSTCAEMRLLGLPAILIDLAENQTQVAHELNRRRAAIHIGSSREVTAAQIADAVESLLLSKGDRMSLSQHSRELIDGIGADRVAAAIRYGDLRLRRVAENDCRQLWEWANDPEIRPVSFDTEPIPWTRHVEWFNSKLCDPDAVLYLVVDAQETPAGQVRFQINDVRAAVSISLARPFRGKGLGTRILAMATEELFQASAVRQIDAYVKPNNLQSLRLFARAGYANKGIEIMSGHPAVHFILENKTTGREPQAREINFVRLCAMDENE
jgi:UDP-2,4-diacetamido-2,4,6-trideoxy-beta-L-altropyranose hydrolase